MDERKRRAAIEDHLEAIRRLESEAARGSGAAKTAWPPDGFYMTWHVLAGLVLGAVAAAVSLILNVVGAPMFGHRPFDLVRTYLTFPMGERALQVEDGAVLTIGSILYLATGAVVGLALHLFMRVRYDGVSLGRRLALATVVGVVLWITSFYLILSWLQPKLLGGNWIVEGIPWWVGLGTHLAFTWSLALGEGMTRFDRPEEATS